MDFKHICIVDISNRIFEKLFLSIFLGVVFNKLIYNNKTGCVEGKYETIKLSLYGSNLLHFI